MKKILIVTLLFLFHHFMVCAQAPGIQWAHCYGGSLGEGAQGIRQTPDGGYILAGNTVSADGDVSGYHGGQDCWVLKTDAAGAIQWGKCLGGSDLEDANNIISTTDGGYILAINTLSNDGDVIANLHADGNSEIWLVKLDNAGNIGWQKCYGGANNDGARTVRQTSDGGYIIAGYTASTDGNTLPYTYGSKDGWIIKLNDTGAIQWQKRIGGNDDDYVTDIHQNIDGTYIVAGYTYSTNGMMAANHGQEDGWVAKLDDTGGMVWIKCFGGSSSEALQNVTQAPDGAYIAAGATRSNDGDVNGNHGDYDYWVLKLSDTGALQWQKCYGGSGFDYADALNMATDGNYFVSGSASAADGDISNNYGLTDDWVIKINGNGSIMWQKSLGGSNYEEGFSATANTDGTCTIGGTTYSNDGPVTGNHGNSDVWVVKLSQWPEDIRQVNSSGNIFVTPNPSDGHFTITLPSLSKNAEITITNILGQVVLQKEISKPSTEISLANVPGVYCILLKQGGTTFTAKLLVE